MVFIYNSPYMKKTNLVYLITPNNHVWLGAKKKSNSWFTISLSKRNGFGWKVDAWETFITSAIRELREEAEVEVTEQQLHFSWIMHFSFETKTEWDQECHIFTCKNFTGTPCETDEMQPRLWDINNLPYENMRDTDKVWLEKLLAGEFVEYIIKLSDTGDMLWYEKIQ